jgi:hypothetical protein
MLGGHLRVAKDVECVKRDCTLQSGAVYTNGPEERTFVF